MNLSMFYVLSILIQHFRYIHVHGAIFLDVYGYGSILFAGPSVGDIAVWYQSACYSMGLNGL